LKSLSLSQWAFLLDVDRDNALNAWFFIRSLLRETGRYPVLSEGWGSDDFFSRFYYREEVDHGKLPNSAPEAILASAPTVDLEAFLASRQASRAESLEDGIDFSLAATHDRFGFCPDRSQIAALINHGTIQSHVELERWLLKWELQNFGEAAIAPSVTRYLDRSLPARPRLITPDR
jgi:hypothetical protein